MWPIDFCSIKKKGCDFFPRNGHAALVAIFMGDRNRPITRLITN